MTQRYPVGWFEIPVADMTRAKTFYEAVFGIALEDAKMPIEMYMWPMGGDLPGACGALVKSEGWVPSHEGVVVYFTAPEGSIEVGLERVKSAGGKVLKEKMSIGEHGFIAFFEDTEGNRIAMHSMQG